VALSLRIHFSWFESGATGGLERGGVGQSSSSSDQRLLGSSGGSGGDIPGHRPLYRHSVVEQVSVALVRLQQDMDSVIARLQSLEALSLAQHQVSTTTTTVLVVVLYPSL